MAIIYFSMFIFVGMSLELEGKLIEKFDAKQITDNFRKREFVIERVENRNGYEFKDNIIFELVQDKCGEIDPFEINSMIKVFFDVKGKRYEKNGRVSYFNNLRAWKISALDKEKSGIDGYISTHDIPLGNIPPEEDDDEILPF